MAKIGYARVSTRSQNDDSQVDDLTAYGCDKIFTDTASGKHAARPELDKALAYLRAGDVLVITRLDGVINQAVDVDEQQLSCQHGGDSCGGR
jgi:DNA invertase Pin-like site-specific DNA recombinase